MVRFLASVVVVAVFLVYQPQQAEAGKVPLVVTYGQQTTDLGVTTAEAQTAMSSAGIPANAHVGFIYESFGLFWLDIWTWKGKFCYYTETEAWEIEQSVAAESVGHAVSVPTWYRFPPGLLVLLLIGVAYGISNFPTSTTPIGSVSRGQVTKKKKPSIAKNPKYKEAMRIYASEASGDFDEDGMDPEAAAQMQAARERRGYKKALGYLVRDGIEQAVAEKNLKALIRKRGGSV